MWKPITKQQNRKRILIYYFMALFFAIAGLWKDAPFLYVVSAALLILALFRKYWLMKRLRD